MKKITREPGKLELYFPDNLQDPLTFWCISDDPLDIVKKKKFVFNKLKRIFSITSNFHSIETGWSCIKLSYWYLEDNSKVFQCNKLPLIWYSSNEKVKMLL